MKLDSSINLLERIYFRSLIDAFFLRTFSEKNSNFRSKTKISEILF